MRSCEEYREWISLVVDHELSEDELTELQAHLCTCEECMLVYEAFQSISDTLSQDLAEPSETLAAGIMYKLHLPDYRSKKRRFAWGRFTAVAACLVLVAFGASRLGLFGVSRSDNVSMTAAAPMTAADTTGEAGVAPADAEEAALDDSARIGAASGENSTDPGENAQFMAPESVIDAPEPESDADVEADFPAAPDTPIDGEDPTMFLMDLSMAEIWPGDSEPEANDEPKTTVTDPTALELLGRLLRFSEVYDREAPDTEPLFTILLTEKDDGELRLSVWLEDSHLLLRMGENGKLYLAEGTLKDLIDFIAKA